MRRTGEHRVLSRDVSLRLVVTKNCDDALGCLDRRPWTRLDLISSGCLGLISLICVCHQVPRKCLLEIRDALVWEEKNLKWCELYWRQIQCRCEVFNLLTHWQKLHTHWNTNKGLTPPCFDRHTDRIMWALLSSADETCHCFFMIKSSPNSNYESRANDGLCIDADDKASLQV